MLRRKLIVHSNIGVKLSGHGYEASIEFNFCCLQICDEFMSVDTENGLDHVMAIKERKVGNVIARSA